MYQQINLSDHTLVGSPAPIAANLVGLSDAVLADISAAIKPPPPGLDGQGFWPVVVTTPSYDATKQVAVPPTSYTADPATQTVTGTSTVRDMTADEYAAANPVPYSPSNYQCRVALVQAGLFAAVDAAIKGADQSVQANQEALQAWEYANNFFRDQPFITALGPTFGLKPADIDNLFRAAAQVP